LAYYVETLLNAISAPAIPRISVFDGQGLANTAWAYAALYLRDEPLINAIAPAALCIISEFEATQNLSNLAWALAQLSMMHAPLLDAISAESIPRSDEFSSQQLANTSWAFASLGCFNSPLSHAISAAAIKLISPFIPSGRAEDVCFGVDLRGLGWAFAFALVLDGDFETLLSNAHLEIGRALDITMGHLVTAEMEAMATREDEESGAQGHCALGEGRPRIIFQGGR